VEAKTATILVTDLVGSTELHFRLGQDAADDLRRLHDDQLRQAIADAEGTVVKSLGDGVLAMFGGAADAVSAAIVIQQAAHTHSQSFPDEPLHVRIGLSSGDVSLEEGDCFGIAVIEATRLCGVADGGQILAAEWVHLLDRGRGGHLFIPAGKPELKGIPEPVPVVEVLWEPRSTTIPLSGHLAVRPWVGIIGREEQSREIREAVEQAANNQRCSLMLVSGEAGQGKTTLVADAAREAYANGATVLFGHCEEDLATPYQLFEESLGHFVAHVPVEQLAQHVEAYGSQLGRLIPALAERIPDLTPTRATDTDSERILLFAAVVGLLSQASASEPIVLVFDDLQWADKASLLLLRHLLASHQTMRVFVLGIYREEELAQSQPLREVLGSIHRQGDLVRLKLGGLSESGVSALVQAAAGHPLDHDGMALARTLHRETDGNPLFVTELLRHLAETGLIVQDATGRWVPGAGFDHLVMPESVREVIDGRVARLGAGAELVLSLAAAIGRDFDLELLAEATKRTEEELMKVIEAAVAVSVVRDIRDTPGRYAFTHALIQRTLYQSLSPTRRAQAHRELGQALESLCGTDPAARIGELARHWTIARPPDLELAIGYSNRAGDAALASLAPADARRFYAQALDLYAADHQLGAELGIDLSIGLGTAQRQMGDPSFRTTLLEASDRAASIGDAGRLVAAALANNRGFFTALGVVDEEKVRVLEGCLEQLRQPVSERALVLATLCQEYSVGHSLEVREELAREALAIAEARGSDSVIIRVHNSVAYPLMAPPLLDQSLRRTADCLTLAEQLGDPVLHFFSAYWRAQASAQAGDVAEMDRCEEIERLLSERLAQPMLEWIYTYHRSWRAMIVGDTDAIEEFAFEALQIASDSGQPDAAHIFGGQFIILNMQRGTLHSIVSTIEQMAAESPGIQGILGGVLAMAYAEVDDLAEVRERLGLLAASDYQLDIDSMWLSGMCFYAEAAIALGDPDYADPLLALLAPYSEQWSSTGATMYCPVTTYLGGLSAVLGRYEDADEFFRRTEAVSQRCDATFFLARNARLWGAMLAQRAATGDRARAAALLSRSAEVAEVHGYGAVAREAARSLDAL
jgi:class 3 adenylate cyclase